MRDFGPVLERCIDEDQRRASGATHTNTYRLFHGRGRTVVDYEDVTVDRFDDALLVGAFSPERADYRILIDALAEALPHRGIVLQSRRGRQTSADCLVGNTESEVRVREAGIHYAVRLLDNQNVGLFLDAAPARNWVRSHAGGASVLNLFAYTCAFSVAAIVGGASSVVNNDMSAPALQWGSHNHALNGHDLRTVRMLPHNLFKSWWKIRQWAPFDLIVVDPPTKQHRSFVAQKDYPSVIKRTAPLVAPGGLLLLCLNSPFLDSSFLLNHVARWASEFSLEERLPAAQAFDDAHPERAAKMLVFRRRG